jgi:hypothetical protein
MDQVVTDLYKSEREPFFDAAIANWDHRDCPQVQSYREIFLNGYRHLILGRTIILPANHGITGLQNGSFRATRFQNGKHLMSRVLSYGFMGNVRQFSAHILCLAIV